MTAAMALAERLGLDAKACQSVLSRDRYKAREVGGDLGNKLAPRQTCTVEVLSSFNYARYKTYDNGLPNFGRLLVIEYANALCKETCLIFGSSSSYSMFNYLCRFFARIVFVHSAGNIDTDVVKRIQPGFLVCQTNARFVVEVPRTDYSLVAAIGEKCTHLTAEQWQQLEKRRVVASEERLAHLGLTAWAQVIPESLRGEAV
ncbi:hypothetical protein [Halomonas sp. E19]|uniref:hypothetical protein n=1 Tax=Halomonas sp. E19 TaxID=3397247 RepID=UPI004033DB82